LVLIHGLGSSLKTFDPVIEELSRSHYVIVYDQRGHGETPYPSRDFSNETMARDLESLLDGLNVGQVSIVGHSLGGRTAVAFAGLFPDRVRALIVEDHEIQPRFKMRNRLQYLALAQVARAVPAGFAMGSIAPEVFFLYRQQANSGDLRPALANFAGPVLFLKAEANTDLSAEGLRVLSTEFPSVTVTEIPSSLHNIHQTQTRVFLDAVLAFLRP
jgi:pimeloyl-ACP methyl ester carboxylesterase